MFKKKELTRLGDILVSKGLISPAQLDLAIQEQSRRKRLLDPSDPHAKVSPIGEILIELGFIDQLQLKRGLNWQQRLRHASIAMALCAPFMMFAPSAAASVVRPAPITVEAENYAAMFGVVKEKTTDIGAGQNLGGISAGDWMTYNVDVPATGNYRIVYRVASIHTTAKFVLRSGADVDLAAPITVPKTGGWQMWQDVEQTVFLQKGQQTLKIYAQVGGFNLNWFRLENVDPEPVAASSPAPAPAPAPFVNVIEAENYSAMSGVWNETTTDVGGGRNTGNINTGDWMTYNNIVIPATGTYKITYRVASLSAGGTFQLRTGATVIDTVSFPKTGGWQTWVNVERTVTLTEGSHNLTLYATAGGFNVNWFRIENTAGSVVSTSSSSAAAQPVSSSSASSVASSTPSSVPSPVASSAASSVTSSAQSSVPSQVASSAASSVASSAATAAGGPIVIQAEHYATMKGVWNETTRDVGGGQNTGNIDTGDWMNYSNTKVTLPFTGKYKITYRVASLNGGGVLALNDAGTNATHHLVSIPKTGAWQTWVDVEAEVDLTEGDHYFTIFAKTGGFNLNWFKIEPIGTAMPLTIQSEDYSAMKGIWNETTTDVGGGRNAGNIDTGDWMDYKNVEVLIPATASYKITYRVASLSAGGRFTFHEADTNTIYDTVTVPVTGGWQKWTSVERIVTLPAGRHFFGVKALLGGFNMNWIKIEPADAATNPVSPPAVSPTSSSSSSSAPAVSSSSSSKPAVSSSSWSSSSAASSATGLHVAGPVGISWTAPDKRENGDHLDITDLGGYEIRYKKVSDSKYTYISINDAWTNTYNFPWLEGDYIFQIAAFDKNGVYSPFVDIQRQ